MEIAKGYYLGFSYGKFYINNGKELIWLEAKTLQSAQKEANLIIKNKLLRSYFGMEREIP